MEIVKLITGQSVLVDKHPKPGDMWVYFSSKKYFKISRSNWLIDDKDIKPRKVIMLLKKKH